MKLLFVSLIALCAVSSAFTPSDGLLAKFEEWQNNFNVKILDGEYKKRLAIFMENDRYIAAHNAKELSWTLGHNEFSHMGYDEFSSAMLGFGGVPRQEWISDYNDFSDVNASSLKDSVDWVAQGAVTAVKNQGQCGSCWAFSTTGSIEGAYFIKNSKLISFSEQELVDCDHNGDQGCGGGLMDNAFGWIKKNGGLCTETSYPYKASAATCALSNCHVVPGSAPQKWTDVAKTEAAFKAAVSQQPVSVAIEADQLSFQFYRGGVMKGNCGTKLDHGVLVVGYGTDDGTDFWKIKNSWGGSWGEQGYIRIERGASQTGGKCGVLLQGSYPTL